MKKLLALVAFLAVAVSAFAGWAIPFSTADVAEAAANTETVLTYAAVPGKAHIIRGVSFSYSAAPSTGCTFTIEDGSGNVVQKWRPTSAGPGPITFQSPIGGSANTALVLRLSAGGSGVIGTISVIGHTAE